MTVIELDDVTWIWQKQRSGIKLDRHPNRTALEMKDRRKSTALLLLMLLLQQCLFSSLTGCTYAQFVYNKRACTVYMQSVTAGSGVKD